MNPMPEGTHSPADDVRPWASLSADEKALFSRMAEVYAGFSEYTDAQVGRIIDYLEETGQLENTLIFYCADNGASGEGSPNGSVNENKFFNGWPDEMSENLKHLDELGSPDTYNHYPTGWAMAFSTPFRMFKRYSYQGGICDPLVISWPKGIKAKGEVRHQYHHSTDIVPTILDCVRARVPQGPQRPEQVPLPGNSMRYSFERARGADAQEAPVLRDARHARDLGGRLEGRDRARPDIGLRPFRRRRLAALPHRRRPPEAHDLAAEEPEKLKQLIAAWFEEAEQVDVLPLDDRFPIEIIDDPRPQPEPPRKTFIYYPDTAEVPESVAVEHARPLVQDPRRRRPSRRRRPAA